MKVYISNPVELSKIQKKVMLYSVFNSLFLVSIVFFSYIAIKGSSLSRLWLLIILLSVILNFVIEGIRLHNMKKYWSSFNIKLSDVSIIKDQNKKPQIEINFNEITRIFRVNGGILIKTLNPKKFIYIPNIIEKYDEFISNINFVKSIEVNSKRIPPEYAFDSRFKYTIKNHFIYVGIGLLIGLLILFCAIGLIFYF